MIELTIIESAVLDLIPSGTQRKIAIKEVSRLVDLDERSIYEVINSLRKKGIPICAQRSGEPSQRGYYIATNDLERNEGISSYKSQVADMQRLISYIEEADVNGWVYNVKRTKGIV